MGKPLPNNNHQTLREWVQNPEDGEEKVKADEQIRNALGIGANGQSTDTKSDTLCLSGLGLRELPFLDWGELVHLQKLSLNRNRLTEIPKGTPKHIVQGLDNQIKVTTTVNNAVATFFETGPRER